MSDKAPVKKLTIEIEDVGDWHQCIAAIKKLRVALREHHGTRADVLFHDDVYDRAEVAFQKACGHFTPEELRLVLEYYAMVKPSKLGLAKDLARRNESLPPTERYGPNGSADEDTMHQQIKRVLRRDEEACRIIGEADLNLRKEKLQWADRYCIRCAEYWAAGGQGTPERAKRRYRHKMGHKSR